MIEAQALKKLNEAMTDGPFPVSPLLQWYVYCFLTPIEATAAPALLSLLTTPYSFVNLTGWTMRSSKLLNKMHRLALPHNVASENEYRVIFFYLGKKQIVCISAAVLLE